MSLEHTLLDVGGLSPEVQRALSTLPGKMMAARGLTPIAHPGDLVTLFYQLVADPDQKIKTAAHKSAHDLPDNILGAGLADRQLDPRVLDYYTPMVLTTQALIQAIILNPSVADETIVIIAERGGTREQVMVSTNQQRLLRHPEIICAMWMNDASLQSTVEKAVELAIHNDVRVPGFPGWEDYKRQILESGKQLEEEVSDGAVVEAKIAAGDAGALRELTEKEHKKTEEKDLQWHELNFPKKMRKAMVGNKEDREMAIRDNNKVVAMAAVRSPKAKDGDATRWASNSALPGEIIAYISTKREWTKSYALKLALVLNPKTPLRESAKFVPHLRDRDMKALARSKAVPSPVNAQAKKLLSLRASGGGRRR